MMLRSRKTQVLQNYFDLREDRVRRSRTSFTPALLNAFALALEEAEDACLRQAGVLAEDRCPLRLDNRGVWWQAFLPAGRQAGSGSIRVFGRIRGEWVELRLYDRGPQIPDRILPDGPPLAWQPSWHGPANLQWAGGPVPFPFRPLLEPEEPGRGPSSAVLEAELHPWAPWRPAWRQEIFLGADGYGAWSEPVSAILSAEAFGGGPARIHACTATMQRVPDPAMPHVDPLDRGRLWPAFWSVRRGRIVREFFRWREAGFELDWESPLPEDATSVCPEPHTPFLVAASAGALYWCDRRERLPGVIGRTAPSAPVPLRIDIEPHPDYPGSPSWLRILLSGSGWTRWRLSAEFPDGTRYLLNPSSAGLLEPAPYRLAAGWRLSPPADEYRFLLPADGDYVFYAEAQTESGILSDALAWRRPRLQVYRSYRLEDQISEIRAVWFDAMERLWIWTGTHVVRMREEYDLYAPSPDGRSLYFSCPYEQIRIEE